MSGSLNRIDLIGNVGSDPEVRTIGTEGKKVVKFSIATNRTWTDAAGAKREKVNWHRCEAWNKLAGIIEQYVHKGDKLYVSGNMEYDNYKKDGVTVYTATVNVREMTMLGSTESREQTPAAVASSEVVDTLPF